MKKSRLLGSGASHQYGTEELAALEAKFRRLLAALVLLAVILLGGMWSYFFLHEGHVGLGDCLYMAVITVTTVGYGEVIPITTPALRAVTMVLAMFGTGSLVYFATFTATLFVEGDVQHYVEVRRMQRALGQIEGHVIVCGAGLTGRQATLDLVRDGAKVVIVERSQSAIDRVKHEVGDAVLAIHDSALDDDVLERAGIRRARALVTALSDDPDNLFVVVSGRSLNPGLLIVSRALTESAARKLRHAGANEVVSPHQLGGTRLAQRIVHPTLTSFFDLVSQEAGARIRLEAVQVGADSAWAGRSLGELDLSTRAPNTVVVGVLRQDGNSGYVPQRSEPLTPGVSLVLFGQRDEIARLRGELEGSNRA
jgi:voltage-gated potassium channel